MARLRLQEHLQEPKKLAYRNKRAGLVGDTQPQPLKAIDASTQRRGCCGSALVVAVQLVETVEDEPCILYVRGSWVQ